MAKVGKKNQNRLNFVLVKPAFLHFILYSGCLSLKESSRKHRLKNKKHGILIKLEFLHFTLGTGFLSFKKRLTAKHGLKNKKSRLNCILVRLGFLRFTLNTGFLSFARELRRGGCSSNNFCFFLIG